MSNKTPQSQEETWVTEFKKAWYRDNHFPIAFEKDEAWRVVERTAAMAYKYIVSHHYGSSWERVKGQAGEIARLREENDMLKAGVRFLGELIDKDLTAAINAGDIPTPSKGQETKEPREYAYGGGMSHEEAAKACKTRRYYKEEWPPHIWEKLPHRYVEGHFGGGWLIESSKGQETNY